MAQRLHFEDNGQDFLRWLVKDGEVVASSGQAWVWVGTKLDQPAQVGKHPRIILKGQPPPPKDRSHDVTILNHRVEKIEEVTDDLTCNQCGTRQGDAGRGVKCEACDAPNSCLEGEKA